LTSSGFELAADDVLLMHDGGGVTGLPFAAAIKAGAWQLIGRQWPNLLSRPVYHRPDRKRVRYLLPNQMAAPIPRKIGWIALLDRHPHAPASVKDLDPVAALGALIADGAAPDHRLSTRGFASLVNTLHDVRCCRLSYSDLDDASNRLLGLCI
jgi:hypothetical protein